MLALDQFKPGVNFQHAVALYVFDKRPRLLALDVLERIEIALHADLLHTLGRLDPFTYLRPDCRSEAGQGAALPRYCGMIRPADR